MHRLRPPRLGALGSGRSPDDDGRAGRRRGAAADDAAASRARTSTASRWAGWSPRRWRSASPSGCAGWCSAATTPGGAVRAAARAARRSSRSRAAGSRERGHPRAAAVLLRVPPRAARARPRAAALLQAPPQLGHDDRRPDAGERSASTPRSRLGRMRAPTLVMHGERDRSCRSPTRGCSRRASPTPSSRSCPAPGTPTASKRPQESLDLLLDWSSAELSRAPLRREEAPCGA